MKCSHCGFELDEIESPPNMSFCVGCGGELVDVSQRTTPTPSVADSDVDTGEELLSLAAIEEPAQESAVVQPLLSVSVNANRFYMEGMWAILELRLDNLSSERIQGNLRCTSSSLGSENRTFSRQPGMRGSEKIQVSPSMSGEALVDVSVDLSDGLYQVHYRGQLDLKVLAKDTAPTNISFNHSINAGDGAQVGFGLMQEGSNVDLASLRRTPNDLLNQEYPVCWVEVPLQETSRRRENLKVVGECRATSSGLIDPITLRVFEHSSQRWMHLLADVCTNMGRSRGNHIVLRYLPRSEENDKMSLRVSGQHLTFRLHEQGVSIENISHNGLAINGKPVCGQEAIALEKPITFDVANAIQLRVTPIRGEPDDGVADRKSLGEIDGIWRMASQNNLLALQIDRINNLAGIERYLLIFRWWDWIPGQVRIVRRGGRWWLVRLAGESELTVDGLQIEVGQAIAMQMDQELRIGETRVDVADFKQWLV